MCTHSQVTFDLLFGTSGNSNAKLKMMAVQFVHQIIYHCPEQRLSPIGAVILSALTRLVNEEKENQKLRGSCYVAIGKLVITGFVHSTNSTCVLTGSEAAESGQQGCEHDPDVL